MKEFFQQQEDTARQVALIVGTTSAAKRALKELEARRADGQDAVIWRDGRKWVVGQRPVDATDSNRAKEGCEL